MWGVRKELWRVVIFPWGLWRAAAWLPRKFRRPEDSPGILRRLFSYLFQAGLYCFIFLPLTIFLFGELLITLHEHVIAEQADYRLQSDFEEGVADKHVDIPGPESYTPRPVPPGQTEAYRRYLAELYSPVVIQKVSDKPQWDVPVLLDYDGTLDTRDNVANEKRMRPHTAGVHGELTAETEDSYYLTYSLYHVKDYDHPVREMLLPWTYHDSDNEGFHIRVDKKTMEVVEVETWFHNRFLLFNRTGESTGSEPVHGTIHTEDKTHVLLYAQPQGHGVRLLQAVDMPSIRKNVKILRFRGDRPIVAQKADRSTQIDVTYELANFDMWYAYARGPFVTRTAGAFGSGIFDDVIPLGVTPSGHPIVIGRFIAGLDYFVAETGSWSRPKPMWSWDDGWDDIPIFVWHFYPSISFNSHSGTVLSDEYIYNRPVEKVFGISPEALYSMLTLEVEFREGEKWTDVHKFGRGKPVEHEKYWILAVLKVKYMAKSYVNYVFHALG